MELVPPSMNVCYVCLDHEGKKVCACTDLPICRECQQRAIEQLAQYKSLKCPVCKADFTNVSDKKVRNLCSTRCGMIIFMLLVLPFSPLMVGLSLAWDLMRSFEIWYLAFATSLFVAARCFRWHLVVNCDDDTACAWWHVGLRQNGPIVL